ncbi:MULTISPECIES: glycosyltransferase [unclassified Bosea (in: a-proteobacteria)]|uniref:glycosyltransferase n=1 Tax=unclassified Bosea (in: a-proteobacteria) TaxID=2653178 RepID=UPI0013E02287|nr:MULTISPECIES: glycosyltransferase [unclassified Bosea (in: a-proteobacteria)]
MASIAPAQLFRLRSQRLGKMGPVLDGRRPRILFVAMHHSVHTARWIEALLDAGFDLHLYPVDPAPPHAYIRGLTFHVPTPASPVVAAPRVSPGRRAARFLRHALKDPSDAIRLLREKLAHRAATPPAPQPPPRAGDPVRIRPVPFDGDDPQARVRLGRPDESAETITALHGPQMLAEVIADVQPDLIHSLEFQHNAYLVLAARDLMLAENLSRGFPRWLATNWGSDIYYFGRDEAHARQIRRVCEAIDLYSCECRRDLALGRSFGYRGPELPVLANSGGIDVDTAQRLRGEAPPSRRKLIMVKGYDHFAGRAMVSLAVLERFADRLKDYEIVMFSVGARPRARALELKAAGVLNIRVIDLATHDEILECFGRARAYLAVSISDGISTSILEAMLMGAFPIQTNTSCCEEWFVQGETGFAVSPDDFEEICARFERALTDDTLVDDAAPRNLEIIRSRLDQSVMKPAIQDFYRQALGVPFRDGSERR